MKTTKYPLPFQKGRYATTNFKAKKEMAMKILMSFLLVPAVLRVPPGLSAQQEKAQTPAAPAQIRSPVEHKQGMPKMSMMSEAQMKECDEMMSRMKEMDARLDAKVAAMAAVIKEMVCQRKEMQGT